MEAGVSVKNAVKELLETGEYDLQTLGEELGVSASTVSRWAEGKVVPRAMYEGRVRQLRIKSMESGLRVKDNAGAYNLPLLVDEAHVRVGLEEALKEVREALHKRGRLSSRNEALDELCKLLFAHVVTPGGMSRTTVLERRSVDGASALLRSFVTRAFAKHLPRIVGDSVAQEDFDLKIRPSEDALAFDIIRAFERLEADEGKLGDSPLAGFDVLNDVFGAFLGDSFVNDKELGQYLTPPEVVRFMVGLAVSDMSGDELEIVCDPSGCRDFGLILDPSCGVGSFFVEFVRSLRPKVESRHGREGTKVWLENMARHVLVGVDKSERMVRLALANMGMSGLPDAHLALANSLAREGADGELGRSLEGRARIILSNPPFGAEYRGADLRGYRIAGEWSSRAPGRVDSELLFIERYVDWLSPGGMVVAIVPDSVLTNKGVYERLRIGLAEELVVRSVVSLPEGTFGGAGTNTKTSVLHARKRARRPGGTITFVAVCKDVGYTVRTRNAQRRKARNGKGDLPKILDAFREGSAVEGTASYSLEIASSVRWDAKYHLGRQMAEGEGAAGWRRGVLVSAVAKLCDERVDPRRSGRELFDYIEISDVDGQDCRVRSKKVPCREAPSRARKVVRAGDVVVSTVRPERKTIGVVLPEQDGSVCSTGLAVLRPAGINGFVLARLLQCDYASAQIMRNTQGINYPAVDEKCLLDVELPIADTEVEGLGELAKAAEASERAAIKAMDALESRVREYARAWEGREGLD